MVMDILKCELETGVHALSIQVLQILLELAYSSSYIGLTMESFRSQNEFVCLLTVCTHSCP